MSKDKQAAPLSEGQLDDIAGGILPYIEQDNITALKKLAKQADAADGFSSTAGGSPNV
ncbi:MAG: hypothetical protein KDE15_01855 [Erythrobacter sp.]|nr:hypothetical protein [Erythrobacter sp.]